VDDRAGPLPTPPWPGTRGLAAPAPRTVAGPRSGAGGRRAGMEARTSRGPAA
jgi:hypothetical protein